MMLQRRANVLIAIVGGVAYAAGYAPRNWWWLTLVGIGIIYWLYAYARPTSMTPPWCAIGLAWAVGFGLSLRWIAEFTVPGWIFANIIQSALATAVLAGVHRLGRRTDLRPVWFVVAVVIGEYLRSRWPFGGVPLALISNSQVDAPYVGTARLGGALGLSAAAAIAAVASVQIARARSVAQIRPGAAAVVALAMASVVGGLTITNNAILPGPIRVAVVQGGGDIGTRARDTDPSQVFAAQVAATRQIDQSVELDLILWPENALALSTPLAGSTELAELSALSHQYDTPISVGVTERANQRQFRNAQVLIDQDGEQARFEKVERVPFGEWIPFRSVIERLADLSAIPRDAITGSGPGVFDYTSNAAVDTVGMTISYEVYFAERGRAGVNAGAQWLHVPTNASSYLSVDVTAATLNATRLQAISLDRNAVQVAPTGWSAVVDNNGDVQWRSSRLQQSTYVSEIELRGTTTLYSRVGDRGVLALTLTIFSTFAVFLDQNHKPRRRNSP
jgi:apolipoprotein N-acyltransferase